MTRAAQVICLIALVWCMAVGYWIWVTAVTIASASRPPFSVPFEQISMTGRLPLVLPVAMAALALWAAAAGSRIGVTLAGLTFVLYAFVTGFSIGAAYVLPRLLLLATGVVWSLVSRRSPAP